MRTVSVGALLNASFESLSLEKTTQAIEIKQTILCGKYTGTLLISKTRFVFSSYGRVVQVPTT